MAAEYLARWHEYVRSGRPEELDELLADDVVFHSPVVFTPQRGKAVTAAYLSAATQTLGGGDDGAGAFRYTREIVGETDALLEFETELDGVHVNGVDLITWNGDGRIVEFKVMVRPLQAVNAVHAVMKAELERMRSSA